jgi:hypothetical protein
MLPQRRDDGLLIEHLADETVVYDRSRHAAHCLDRLSTRVWELCDGRTSPAGLVEILRGEPGVKVDETVVRLILERLGEASLLRERHRPEPAPAKAGRRTRRTAARELALLALGGIVLSLAAPTPAAAASSISDNSICTSSSQCCANCCKAAGGGANQCKSGGGDCLP